MCFNSGMITPGGMSRHWVSLSFSCAILNYLLVYIKLGTSSLREFIETLEEVVKWFQLGIHLGIPHYELSIIKADHELEGVRRCKTEMFNIWLKNAPEAKWSTIVKALVKAGMEDLAHKIALHHGILAVTYSFAIHS